MTRAHASLDDFKLTRRSPPPLTPPTSLRPHHTRPRRPSGSRAAPPPAPFAGDSPSCPERGDVATQPGRVVWGDAHARLENTQRHVEASMEPMEAWGSSRASTPAPHSIIALQSPPPKWPRRREALVHVEVARRPGPLRLAHERLALLDEVRVELRERGRVALDGPRLGSKRVIQRRFNVSGPRRRVPKKASTLRDRSKR